MEKLLEAGIEIPASVHGSPAGWHDWYNKLVSTDFYELRQDFNPPNPVEQNKENDMSNEQEITETLIAMESAALRRWGNGDPSGFLEICASDVVYFDPYLDKRIEGMEALTKYYKSFWGQVRFDRFELINPCVQVGGELAVLTFNYASYTDDKKSLWNCTEVYRQSESGWQIIQTHWSYTHHPGIVGN